MHTAVDMSSGLADERDFIVAECPDIPNWSGIGGVVVGEPAFGNRPVVGDSRLPNVIYRDFTPVGLLDWDLVSLAGPQADIAWWILMTPQESMHLDGVGTHDEFVDLWEELTGNTATDLHWFLVFGAYRLAAIMAKLFSMFVAHGRMPAEFADAQLNTGLHVQILAGMLDLTPPKGVTPTVLEVRWDRG